MRETSFVWQKSDNILFCHVGFYVGQVEEVDDFNQQRYVLRILWSGEKVDGVTLVIDSYEYADTETQGMEWIEERIRQLHQPNEVNLALAILSRLSSELWTIGVDSNGNEVYTRDITPLGNATIQQLDSGYVYIATSTAKKTASGTSTSITNAKNKAVSALFDMYLTEYVRMDGNTLLNNMIAARNRLDHLNEF